MSMRSPGAELKKSTSRRGYLFPFRSFSTSRLLPRVQPSPERPEKPKKESGGFFAQLRRSFTLGPRSSSSPSSSASSPSAAAPATPARSFKGAASPAWGKRVKNGLSKPLKVVTSSYVDCMMAMSEDPRVESVASMGFQHPQSPLNAFQYSASRRLQHSPTSAGEGDLAYPSDAQLLAVLRSSRQHAHLLPSE